MCRLNPNGVADAVAAKKMMVVLNSRREVKVSLSEHLEAASMQRWRRETLRIIGKQKNNP